MTKAIGIMSGTSLDGIDIILCDIKDSELPINIKTLITHTYPMPVDIKAKILKSIALETNVKDITSLNFELGYMFADAVNAFIKANRINKDDITFIASHGQTLYHIPKDEKDHIRSTLQLGDGSIIANQTGIDTIYNFRVADMAVGGQGAPLVPFADYILFQSDTINRALHNLGGISNLTILEKSKSIEDVRAFDTGPANMMIDYAMQVLFNQSYDEDGLMASQGDVIIDLLDTLMANPYIKQQPPKSTGRELFGDTYTASLLKQYQDYDKKDIIATLTEFTILTIIDAYQNLVDIPLDEIICSGGGAHNKYIMKRLEAALYPIKVLKIEDLGFDSKSKEALAFVLLGNQTIKRQTSNIKRATGASQSVILGQICYANKGGSL